MPTIDVLPVQCQPDLLLLSLQRLQVKQPPLSLLLGLAEWLWRAILTWPPDLDVHLPFCLCSVRVHRRQGHMSERDILNLASEWRHVTLKRPMFQVEDGLGVPGTLRCSGRSKGHVTELLIHRE